MPWCSFLNNGDLHHFYANFDRRDAANVSRFNFLRQKLGTEDMNQYTSMRS